MGESYKPDMPRLTYSAFLEKAEEAERELAELESDTSKMTIDLEEIHQDLIELEAEYNKAGNNESEAATWLFLIQKTQRSAETVQGFLDDMIGMRASFLQVIEDYKELNRVGRERLEAFKPTGKAN